MIRDFKAQIFCRESNLSKREIDAADPIWIERIDAFFRQTSLLPPDGDPTEYAKAFEAVYPQPRHRRQYIDDAISKGTPCFGHTVLGSLIAAGKVDCIFTTNFDPLIEESAHSANAILPVEDQNRPTVAAIDSADRAMRCLNESDWPLVAKLHGDYQSIAIKNTGSELEEQDARMRHVLVEAGTRFGMVFVGYSGRDASTMEALTTVLDTASPFPNGLYWLTSSASRLLPAVTEFLSRAQAAGVDVAVVECATFDELSADIVKTTDLPQPLFDRVMEGRPTPRLVLVQVPTAEARAFPVLRYSSLLVARMPRKARRMRLAQSATSPAVRELLKKNGVRATVAAHGRGLAVFGRDRDILDALAPLGATLDGEVELNPVADSWALGLLYDALVRALAQRLPLIPRYKRAGHSAVIAPPREGDDPERARRHAQVLSNLRSAYKSDLTGTVPDRGRSFTKGGRHMNTRTTTALAALIAAGIAGAAAAEIRIGASVSATGPAAFLGDPEAKTLEMLVEEVNAAGGVGGEEIELILYDDGGDPNEARTFATRLVEDDEVVAIIGGSTTGTTMSIVSIAEDEEIPFISLAGAIEIVDPVKAFVFKTPHTDRMACEKIFEDMQARGITKIGMISGTDGFGASMEAQCKDVVGDYGIDVVASETYGPQDADMTPQLTNIRGTEGVDAILNPGFGQGPTIVTRNAAQLGIDVPLYQSHGVASDAFIELAGPEAAEGVRLPGTALLVADLLPEGDPQKAVATAYKAAYKEEHGSEPSTFGGYAHDAFRLMVDAIERAGGAEPQAIRDALEATESFVSTLR